jgi:LacI family transcriptional regulator
MVAAEAGVGVGTVSRVLNGSPQVREETRRRVLEVMEEMQYRPSRAASSLSRGSTRTISVLVTFLTRPSVVQRLAGVITVLDAQGYDTVVFNIETAEQRDRHINSLAREAHTDGAIIISLPLDRPHLEAIKVRGLPVVVLDAESPGPPRFVIDNEMGGRMATEHLLSLGHRRIGFVGDFSDQDLAFTSTEHRLRGYEGALIDAGIDVDPEIVSMVLHSGSAVDPISTESAMVLLNGPKPPTAIFAASDVQAIGLMHAIEEQGLRVPDDMSVIGFDDIDAAGLVRLSTIRQPLAESGAIAARKLCDLLDGGRPGRRRTVLPLELVSRATTAAPAKTSSAKAGAPRRRTASAASGRGATPRPAVRARGPTGGARTPGATTGWREPA